MPYQPITIQQPDWQRFLTTDGLAEKAGCSSEMFPMMVAKEFADNAADVGGFTAEIDEHNNKVIIRDNGPGLSIDEIRQYYSIKRPLTSSKHWRRAERGALGNGIRAALAGCRLANIGLRIGSHGSIHTVTLQGDGEVAIGSQADSQFVSGTTVELTYLNGIPHNLLRYIGPQFKTQGVSFVRGKPQPSWFKSEDLSAIIRSLDSKMLVSEFADQFNLRTPISDCIADKTVSALDHHNLRKALVEAEGNTSINTLGKHLFESRHYNKHWGTYIDQEAEIPYCLEVWAKARKCPKNEAQHSAAVFMNGTPMLGSFTLDTVSGRLRVSDYMSKYQLRSQSQINRNMDREYDVILSIISPFIPIVSSGKAPALVDTYGSDLLAVLEPALKKANKLPKEASAKARPNLIQATDMVLKEAYNKVSSNGKYWANARQLMYAARPKILEITGLKSFTDSYFSQTLLPDYLLKHPEETKHWRVAYDERGDLIQPHTRSPVGLGTVEVDKLQRRKLIIDSKPVNDEAYISATPENRFNGIIFIEKEGFNQAILESGILERYDLALASTKGQSVIALRVLIDEMTTRNTDFKVFTMTDFDTSGSSIRTTLTGDNRRRYSFNNNVTSIPICVSWDQAQILHERGLSEPVNIQESEVEAKTKTLIAHGLPRAAISFLLLDKLRVEINAFTTEELLYEIENTVKEHCRKVLPDEVHLNTAWRQALVKKALREKQEELVAKYAETQAPEGILERVAEKLVEFPQISWEEAIISILNEIDEESVNNQ